MSEAEEDQTKRALDQLGLALLSQLDDSEAGRWLEMELQVRREALDERVAAAAEVQAGVEGRRFELTVRLPEGDAPRIVRPETVAAYADLERTSVRPGAGNWRGVRFVVTRQPDGRPKYQCWWAYDRPGGR